MGALARLTPPLPAAPLPAAAARLTPPRAACGPGTRRCRTSRAARRGPRWVGRTHKSAPLPGPPAAR